MAAGLGHRIGVHAENLLPGEQLPQLRLHLLRAGAHGLHGAAAVGAPLQHRLGVAAVVAEHPPMDGVVGEAHAAPGTRGHLAALDADAVLPRAAAVQEQNALAALGHGVLQRQLQGKADGGAVAAAQLLLHIHQLHLGQRAAVEALRQLVAGNSSLPGQEHRLQ